MSGGGIITRLAESSSVSEDVVEEEALELAGLRRGRVQAASVALVYGS